MALPELIYEPLDGGTIHRYEISGGKRKFLRFIGCYLGQCNFHKSIFPYSFLFPLIHTIWKQKRISLRKILSNERSAPAIDLLHQTGLDKSSLGCELSVSAMPKTSHDLRLVTLDFGWLVVLAAIIPQADVTSVLARLRLSRAEQKFCAQLAASNPRKIFADLSATNWRQFAFSMGGRAAAYYACAAWRLGAVLDQQHYRVLHQWQPPKLPVSGADLLSHGVDKGEALGQMLRDAERLWVQSDFTMTKSALLSAVVK